jgi:hypothetical protein
MFIDRVPFYIALRWSAMCFKNAAINILLPPEQRRRHTDSDSL